MGIVQVSKIIPKKGIVYIRSRQRAMISVKAAGTEQTERVLLRVPIEEVHETDDERSVSYPKYYQEMPSRIFEHYNVKPDGNGIWCEVIVNKDEADAIVKAHNDAVIMPESEDSNIRV